MPATFPLPRCPWAPVVLAALSGCIIDAERGPDVGPCADLPEGVYSWGDIGIGSCLAGPADLRFLTDGDGKTWLAVSNADPYRSFVTGSILLIDYEAVDTSVPKNLVHELPTYALPIADDDDGDGQIETAMLGQIGVLGDGRLIVPGRHTEEGVAEPSFQNQLRAGADELYVIDVDPPSDLVGQTPQVLELRDDPFTVVVGDDGLAYVGNLTDHSVSVLSVDDAVEPVDVATTAAITGRTFTDAAGLLGHPSTAELLQTTILAPSFMADDVWTLTYVHGNRRTYLPTEAGMWRHDAPSAVGSEVPQLQPAPTGPDFDTVGVVSDPFYFLVDGLPLAVLADTDVPDDPAETGRSTIRRALGGTTAASWDLESAAILSTADEDAIAAGPSLVGVEGLSVMYYDGRDRIDADACIYRAQSADNGVSYAGSELAIGTASCPAASLVTDFDEVAQPFVRFDSATGRYRMWFSARDDDQWVVAHALSDDGLSWRDPQVVFEEPGASAGGPTVSFEVDHYRMSFSILRSPLAEPQMAEAVSVDGYDWSRAFVVSSDPGAPLTWVPSGHPTLPRPVRPGALFSPTASWRVEGRDFGILDNRVFAGEGDLIVLQGFAFGIAHGHLVPNNVVPSGWARNGLQPGSVVDVDGRALLYATATGADGRRHVVVLEADGDPIDPDTQWSVVEPFDAIDADLAPAGGEATDPVVVADADGYVMFYGYSDNGSGGDTRIRRATSTDGLSWQREQADVVGDDDSAWDATQLPHSVEVTPSGYTLWYAGNDTSRFRIGAASATDLRGPFTPEPGLFDPWRFGTGIAGSFDDSGVKDPLVVEIDGERHLYYAGFDGDVWSLGHAVADGDEFVRRVGMATDDVGGGGGTVDGGTTGGDGRSEALSLAAHNGLQFTFSSQGVESPVLMERVDTDGAELFEMLYAGFDGLALRLGRARSWSFEPDVVYADPSRPTTGDELGFRTQRGGDGVSVVELAQNVNAFVTDGVGMSAMTYDAGRGMLYTASKLSNGLFAIDVRDDSSGAFFDDNVFDLEAVMRPTGGSAAMGFRGLQLVPDRGLLYATSTSPDGLWVFDLDTLVDDDRKEDLYDQPVAVLPLPASNDDAGERSQSIAGGSGMALAGPNDELLLVTHFRDNSLFVFDLSLGDVGEQVAYLPFLGENPHVVRVAPDGLSAVVANYTGDVVDGLASSTLVVIDLDPTSETYLEPLTWIANK